MKNRLSDLNNHLFAQMEKLADDELSGEELVTEIHRSKAMSALAQQIVDNGKLALEAVKVANKTYSSDQPVPKMLVE